MDMDYQLSQSLLKLVSTCVQASSKLDDVNTVLAELNSIVPFDWAAIVIDTKLNFALHDHQQVIDFKMEQDWVNLYFNREYYKVDPILTAVDDTASAVSWRQVYDATPGQATEFKLTSKKYVGDNGLTILQKTEHGSTLISLCFPPDVDVNKWALVLEFITPHIHEIFNREGEYQRKCLWQPQLTDRELDVLNWVKEGKSNWDISQLLSISERTVKFHLSNIYEKLSVVNRSQSIAKAIHYGIIST